MSKNLLLFCYSLSKKDDYHFLINEIKFIKKDFEKIIIIPQKKDDNEEDFTCHNIFINNSLCASYYKINYILSSIFKILFCKYLWKEVFTIRDYIIKNLLLIFKERYKAEILNKWVKTNKLDNQNNIFYSFWANHNLISFFLLKNENKKFKSFSRCLGSDLKGFTSNNNFVPFKNIKFKNLDLILILNEEQKKILEDESLIDINRIRKNYLGIRKQDIKLSNYFIKNKIRICSCGNLVNIKNTFAIIDFIKIFNNHKKKYEIEFMLIGKGPLQKEIEKYLNMNLKDHSYKYIDEVENLINFFKDNEIDLFINLSYSEGMSFAVMEALSMSIPVICSNIPGNTEIVDSQNGYILMNNDKEQMKKLSIKILNDLDSQKLFLNKKYESLKTVEEIIDNKINSEKFINILKEHYNF